MNIITEEHATSLACPFPRALHPCAANGNCVASKCMAWAWSDENAGVVDYAQKAKPTRGYCALMRQPSPS